MFLAKKIPVRVERLPWRAVDGRAVIVHPKNSEVHDLNDEGTYLWEKADGSRSLEQMTSLLTDEFDIDPEHARSDVSEFFSALVERGLIEWRS